GVVKYTWPGKNLKEAGIPNRTLLLGGLAGIVGFFVIPVVGLFVGFVVGVYLSEMARMPDNRQAWASSKHAIKGVGLSILVELLGALLATGVWVIGAVLSAPPPAARGSGPHTSRSSLLRFAPPL